MPRYEIKQGTARAEVNAVSFAAAVNRGVQLGFKNPDVVRLMESAEEMKAARAKAMAAYAKISGACECGKPKPPELRQCLDCALEAIEAGEF